MAKKAAVMEPKKATKKPEVKEKEKGKKPSSGGSVKRIKRTEVIETVQKLGGDRVDLRKIIAALVKVGASEQAVINHVYACRASYDPILLKSEKEDGMEYITVTKAGAKFVQDKAKESD